MSTTRLQILASEIRKYPGRDGKQGGQFQICQCVIHGERIEVGQLMVYGELAAGEQSILPGVYDVEFTLAVGFTEKDRGRIVPRLVSLKPVSGTRGAPIAKELAASA